MDLIRRIICLAILAAVSVPVLAQKKVSADVETKTVSKGRLVTVTKSVYCTSNGRLVTIFRTPLEYYIVANTKGEMQIYKPETNEVLNQYDPSYSSLSEPVMLFMSGHFDDLGLGQYGYKAVSTEREDGYVKKKFTPSDVTMSTVEIVYENYLPIYCQYTAPDGGVVSRKYLSDYSRYGRLMLPRRITDIEYAQRGAKRDSTVVRTIYSNILIDQDDPAFDFRVPADAKPMKLDEKAQ